MSTKVYAVFLKLEDYYDDNDRMLEALYFKYEDAANHVEQNKHWQDLFIEDWYIQ